MGPERVMVEKEVTVTACPLCGCEVTGHTALKNGSWTFEPVENFGITDPDDGMVCMEWNGGRVWFYYHSPDSVEQGELDALGES